MFDRVYVKLTAKNRMRGYMGNAILVSLLAALLGGELAVGGFRFRVDLDISDLPDRLAALSEPGSCLAGGVFSAVIAAAGLLAALYAVFVGYVVQLGARGWYLRYARGEYPSAAELFAPFRAYYLSNAGTMLVVRLYIALWSLLLVIPGIVKGYAYSMTPYILYENPTLSAGQAIRLSSRLTDGSKMALFVFDLSYFGWLLLSGFTAGILGVVYVNPYMSTAHAGIYDALKAEAIRSGRMTWEDFGQAAPLL